MIYMNDTFTFSNNSSLGIEGLSFGSHFPEEYFLGKKKEAFIAKLAAGSSCALECYKSFVSLCESLPLTSGDRSMCLIVLDGLFSINSNWFLMPTSSTGKYHGGIMSPENYIGGIYHHCARLCKFASSVLVRYKEVIDGLDLSLGFNFEPSSGSEVAPSPFDFSSKLLACCVLHDIGKMNLSQDCVYSVADHGEVAASFIESLGFTCEGSVLYAISNHMYGWKAINCFNHIVASGASVGLVLLLMLCECDFFSSIY